MGRYSMEASRYASNVANFKATANQILSSITANKSKLSGTKDSSLKSNVLKSLNGLSVAIESIISDASSNVSRLSQKASELDALEYKSRTREQGNKGDNEGVDKTANLHTSNPLPPKPNLNGGEINYE